jgi:serine/threonine protein phosphatase PrpC
MGQALTHPLTNKLMQRQGNSAFRVGVAAMQGYRTAMEDAHSVRLNLSSKKDSKHSSSAFFGVYDGHAGDKASQYLSTAMPDKIASLSDPTDAEILKAAVLAVDGDFLTK